MRPSFVLEEDDGDAASLRGHEHPAALLALADVDLADRRGELVGAEGLDQELACAGEHRAPQVVGLALHGHHDDRRARQLRRDPLGRRDAVHAGHVDVHEQDVGVEPRRHLERLFARGGRAHDLDVGLEGQQLGEMLARLGDVVDDDDPDLLGHERFPSPVAPLAGGSEPQGTARCAACPRARRYRSPYERARAGWAAAVRAARMGDVKAGSVCAVTTVTECYGRPQVAST